MIFRIGSYRYTVKRKWHLSHKGQRCEGLCASASRTIWLDGDVPADMIVGVLRHEHAHAWEFEVGTPASAEERASFTATVGDAFEYEFSEQGGLAALLAIPVDGIRGARRPPAAESGISVCSAVQCGSCQTMISSGSIYTGQVEQIENTGVYAVDRGTECPFCGNVQVWREKATPGGFPLGIFLQAKMLRGQEAREWLASHQVDSVYVPA